jgi:PAS domain S-box-containing protein
MPNYGAITRHAQVERVEERTAALLHEKERVEAILRGSNDVILFLRDDGRVAQANPAFAETFGCPVEDILEQPVLTLTTPTYAHLLGQALNSVIRLRKPARLEIAAVCNSSRPFDADFALSPVTYDNRLVGVVCTVRDVTPQKQVEAQLRQTLAREMQLGEMRARFISMASHEFRNPLAVILASVSLLESYADRMDPEMTKRKFDQIRLQIAYLTELLNDVLLYTKNEMGRIEFEPEPGRIDLLCGEMVDNMRYAVAEEHEMVFAAQGTFPLLQIDPKLLRQIVGNLVSNALKYSPPGSTIRIDLVSRERDILLRVADEGIGIPAASQSHMFEAFHRAENALNIPGTGLGLAIVKQAAELHGGSVSFVSEEGRGTTFEVVLPQIPVQEGEVSPPAAPGESR